jgi:formate dehydrogenase major subunit
MVTLTINDRTIEVDDGMTVLAAARQAGIFIPTLCAHPALRSTGHCRLCEVEVKGARGPQTACTLPVSPGMVVTTDTPALRESRRFVLGMLFSEGNHVCPICPVSGGDCDLQNSAYHEQMANWPYLPAGGLHAVDASAAHFIFDPNRCVLCRRCVRACDELVGNRTLGVAERGANSHLVADAGVPWGESSCVSCGACVQVCPTGALFDRSAAYQGRMAQTQSTRSICVGCGVGCGITIQTRDGRLVKVEGDWSSPVSGGLLCRAGRYSPLDEQRERIVTPLVRRGGKLATATWDEALDTAAAGLRGAAGFVSPRLPAEALLAFRQVLSAGLPSAFVTHNPNGHAGHQLAENGSEADLAALRGADLVILLGVTIERSHPVAGFFVKRNLPRGLRLVVVGQRPQGLDEQAELVVRLAPGMEASLLKAWLGALEPGVTSEHLSALAEESGVPAESLEALAECTATANDPVLVYDARQHRDQPAVARLLENLTRRSGRIKLLGLREHANGRAAEQLGLEQSVRPEPGQPVFVDLGDDEPSESLLAAVHQASFLAVAASYYSGLTDRADVVLPVEAWTEQSGHYLNLEGRWQVANKALAAPAEVWSNAAMLAGLTRRLGVILVKEIGRIPKPEPALAADSSMAARLGGTSKWANLR